MKVAQLRSALARAVSGSLVLRASLLIAFAVVGVSAVWPAVAFALAAGARESPHAVAAAERLASSDFSAPSAILLCVNSASYAFAFALVGTLLAWSAARALRAAAFTRARLVLATIIALPLALPPWLLFAGLWLSVGPGSAIGDYAERADLVALLRQGVLVIALVTWCAAPAFVVLLLHATRSGSSSARLLQLDGAGWRARLRAACATDARVLCECVALLTIFLLGETTAFDLAQVPTYAFELRTQDALGATPRQLLTLAWPALALACLAALALPALMTRSRAGFLPARDSHDSHARVALSRRDLIVVASAAPSVVVLIAFVAALARIPRSGDFFALHGSALLTQLLVCAAAASGVALYAACLRAAMLCAQRAARGVIYALLAIGALAAFVPGTLAAVALVCAFNREWTSGVYDSLWIEVIALTQRLLLVASVVVLALSMHEHAPARRLRALDGERVLAQWRGMRREVARAASVTAVLSFALALGELTVTGRVAPPGVSWLATDILNAIHYQRPETVLLSAGALMLVASAAAWMVISCVRGLSSGGGSSMRVASRVSMSVVFGALLLVAVPSCSDSPPPDPLGDEPVGFDRGAPAVASRLSCESMLSGVGRGRGQFNGPRVVACDSALGETYVIDKDARVQRFARDGTVLSEWTMPKSDRGRPVGATVAPDGSLIVVDTHEHRLVCFTPEGRVLWELGGYGRENGQFIYPTDVAFAPDGRMFVAEYGGNDRIQVFGRDRAFLYAFGTNGSDEGQLLRPQAMAYDAARDELYVADASNHRVVVFTGDGEFRRALGKPGRGEGEFMYPFGLALEIGGVAVTARSQNDGLGEGTSEGSPSESAERTILVAEHSNHRVQRINGESGEVLAVAGGIGRSDGQLKYPWAIEPAFVGTDGVWRYAVCDHGNSRIQFVVLPFAKRVTSEKP